MLQSDALVVTVTLPMIFGGFVGFGGVVLGAMKMAMNVTRVFSEAGAKFEKMAEATQKQTNELSTVVEELAVQVVSLRIDRHVHKEKFMTVEGQIEDLESSVGEVWHVVDKMKGVR